MINAESFEILTTSSFCSITLIAKLPDDMDSPYISLKYDDANFMQPIRKILIKIIPSHNLNNSNIKSNNEAVIRYDGEYNNMVMISSLSQVEKEYNIQKNLYLQSITDPELPLYPICPAILYYENQVTNPVQFESFFNGKLKLFI
jgi:hypothetical protein